MLIRTMKKGAGWGEEIHEEWSDHFIREVIPIGHVTFRASPEEAREHSKEKKQQEQTSWGRAMLGVVKKQGSQYEWCGVCDWESDGRWFRSTRV